MKKISIVLVSLCFLILFSGIALANYTLQDGLNAYNAQDYKKALTMFTYLSNQKDSQAQYILGSMYLDGLGVKKDYNKAYDLFLESARQNNSFGQYALGYMYKHGLGVREDFSKTLYWWGKSAKQNNREALYGIGFLYSLGQGVKLDYQKSFDYWQKAAYLGSIYAQYRVGLLYFEGGIEKNYAIAYAWFDVAKKFSNPKEEIYKLASHHLGIVKYRLTNSQMSEAKDLAGKLYEKIKNNEGLINQ